MIHNHDRSKWFGASDTSTIMGRWDTKTFERFWRVKLGIDREHFETLEMKTGTYFERKILDSIGVKERDRQIKIRRLRLRVNLDGETDVIHEVKTHRSTVFRVSKANWQQAQVEMFAAKKPLEIVSYHLLPEDYKNWFSEVDQGRIARHPIAYDEKWVSEEYLPRLEYLSERLRMGEWP